MRIYRYAALLTALSLMLCGCGLGDEVESRAYVLALGVDRADEGGIELTVRVPKISKPDSAEKEGGSDSPYLTFSASGETLREAGLWDYFFDELTDRMNRCRQKQDTSWNLTAQILIQQVHTDTGHGNLTKDNVTTEVTS